MAKHSRTRSPSDEAGPSRRPKAKRPCVAGKPPPPPPAPLATTSSSSWALKRARGARRPRPAPIRRCWSNLTYTLAGVIAELALANDMSDYMSFRAVCREWRRGAVDAASRAQGCLDRRFHPRQWIMLREAAPPGPARHRRRFLNVSTGECVHKDLPELDGHHLLGATAEGLLALLDESTFVVRLLNPTTRQLAELPSLDPVLSDAMRIKIITHEFTVPGIGLADDDSTVALCLSYQLLIAKPGDDSWKTVRDNVFLYSAMSFSGRFYCVTGSAVMMLEISRAANETPQLKEVSKMKSWGYEDTVHLVEIDGKLLLVRSWRMPSKEDYKIKIRKYRAYRVRAGGRKVVPVRGLSGRAVFLGERRALSVSTSVFPSLCSNTVYLSYDVPEKVEMGAVAYNLHERRITEHCSKMDDYGRGWVRPCGIGEYLSWYVSGKCHIMGEI